MRTEYTITLEGGPRDGLVYKEFYGWPPDSIDFPFVYNVGMKLQRYRLWDRTSETTATYRHEQDVEATYHPLTFPPRDAPKTNS
jgi:hypothetical protein